MGFLLVPDARSELAAYLLLFLAGSLLSIVAARSLSVSRPGFVIACAAAFRATLLARAPDLSPDVYRYLWDGRVAATAASPYAVAPRDRPDLFPDLQPRLEHREFHSVYPPVAQAVFRIGGALGGATPQGIYALKALFAAADVGVVALLARPLSSPFAAALYAFHPLPVTEVAGQGHLDPLGVVLLLAALSAIGLGRRGIAGLAFAAAALTKYVSAATVLPFARRGGLRFVAAAGILAAALWGLASPGGSPATALPEFAARWEFNALVYPAVAAAVDATELPDRAKAAFIRWKERREHRPWMQAVFPYFYTAFFARAALAIVLAAALVGIAWRVRDLEAAVYASLAALLLASPTLHPWYLLWILPFAAKRRDPAFFYLSSAAPLAYGLLYPLPGWSPLAIRVAEYAPFAGLLGLAAWRARRRR